MMPTDDAGYRGQEAQVSGGRGGFECHFYQEGDILKNMPQVFLRNEDECALGGLVSKYVLLSPMGSKAKEAVYSNHLLKTVRATIC